MADGGTTITEFGGLPPDEQQVLDAYRKLSVNSREWLLRTLRHLEIARPTAPVASSQERAAAMDALAQVRQRRVALLKLGDKPLPSR